MDSVFYMYIDWFVDMKGSPPPNKDGSPSRTAVFVVFLLGFHVSLGEDASLVASELCGV